MSFIGLLLWCFSGEEQKHVLSSCTITIAWRGLFRTSFECTTNKSRCLVYRSSKMSCVHMTCKLHFFSLYLHFMHLSFSLCTKQGWVALGNWRSCSYFFPFVAKEQNGSWCLQCLWFLYISREGQAVSLLDPHVKYLWYLTSLTSLLGCNRVFHLIGQHGT